MEKVLEQLATSKKHNFLLLVALGVFLGIQYAEFKGRLTRIEDRISVLELKK